MPEGATSSRPRRAWRLLALAASAAVIVWRHPAYFTRPRFWAEEGAMYFANAVAHAHTPDWYRGLTYTLHGYLAVWPNLATTAAANLVPPEFAPLVTTLLAFAVQLLPIVIVLWGQSRLWPAPWQKLVASAIVLLTPLSAEPWLNTINSQFYFALATFLLLVEDTAASAPGRWSRRAVLLVAGLTGPASCFLTPLYIVRAVADRHRERAVQAGVLVAAALVQLSLLLSRPDSTLAGRTTGFPLGDLIPIVWNQSVSLTLLGLERAIDFLRLLRAARLFGQFGVPIFSDGLLLAMLAAEVVLFLVLARGLAAFDRVSFLGAYCLLIVLSLSGTLEDKSELVVPGWAHRYFMVPNIILLLSVLTNLDWRRRRFSSTLLAVVLAHALYLGGVGYRTVVFADPQWPDWRAEVGLWRQNPDYQPRIWPLGPLWVVKLRPESARKP